MNRLNILLKDMEVPVTRRDISKLENVLWLLRNVRIRNLDNPSIGEVVSLLKQEAAKMR